MSLPRDLSHGHNPHTDPRSGGVAKHALTIGVLLVASAAALIYGLFF